MLTKITDMLWIVEAWVSDWFQNKAIGNLSITLWDKAVPGRWFDLEANFKCLFATVLAQTR